MVGEMGSSLSGIKHKLNKTKNKFLRHKILREVYRKFINTYLRFKKRPSILRLEITNVCNANCIICPRLAHKRKLGFMEFGTFKKIIDSSKDLKIKTVLLQNFGEPFLHKSIFKMIGYACKNIENVNVVTNGSLLNNRNIRRLMNTAVKELSVSLDSMNPEVYNKIRRNLNFSDVFRNIENLVLANNSLPKEKRKKIRLTMCKMDINSAEENKFVRYCKTNNLIYTINDVTSWAGLIDADTLSKKRPDMDIKYIFPCKNLFDELVFLWSGEACICCVDINGKFTFGNIRDKSIKEIWNCEKMCNWRKIHLRGKRNKMEICRNCDYQPW